MCPLCCEVEEEEEEFNNNYNPFLTLSYCFWIIIVVNPNIEIGSLPYVVMLLPLNISTRVYDHRHSYSLTIFHMQTKA